MYEGYFATVHAAFSEAMRRPGDVQTRRYRIAGQPVEMHFAGAALREAFTPSFAHLAATDSGQPALRVLLCDEAETGAALPMHAAEPIILPRGDILGLDDGAILAANVADDLSKALFDPTSRTAIYWTTDARRLPQYERCAPLRSTLNWWLQRLNGHMLHGAAVGRNGKGVLLVGLGGSGKSTTSLSCLLTGMDYLGDDYVAVTQRDEFVAHSVYCRAKVTDGSLALLPNLRDHVPVSRNGAEEKSLVHVFPAFAAQLRAELRLRAIVLPRVTGDAVSSLAPISGGEPFRQVAISTIKQLPGAGPALFEHVAAMVKRLPNYELRLGRDVERVPAMIQALAES